MRSENWMFALKLFLPSWNFFNDFTAVPQIEIQLQPLGAESQGWQPLFDQHTTRNFWRVVFNPAGNLELLEKSLVDRAVTELEQLPTSDLTKYATTKSCAGLIRLARARIRRRAPLAEGTFRFRLVLVDPARARDTRFVSAKCSIQEPGA